MIRQHHRITHATALTLALAATAAPCAWADPAPLAKAEAAIAARQTPQGPSPTTGANPRGVAITPSQRSALPSQQAANPSVRSNPDNQPAAGLSASTGPAARVASDRGNASGTVATRVVRVVTPADDFDWRDAGLGAGASLLLVGLGLAAARAAASGRKPHTRDPRATATG